MFKNSGENIRIRPRSNEQRQQEIEARANMTNPCVLGLPKEPILPWQRTLIEQNTGRIVTETILDALEDIDHPFRIISAAEQIKIWRIFQPEFGRHRTHPLELLKDATGKPFPDSSVQPENEFLATLGISLVEDIQNMDDEQRSQTAFTVISNLQRDVETGHGFGSSYVVLRVISEETGIDFLPIPLNGDPGKQESEVLTEIQK